MTTLWFKLIRLLQIYSIRLVLQVFGAGGAIWGFAEIIELRNSETQSYYRDVTQLVAAVFAMRFGFQVMDFLRYNESEHHETPNLRRMFQVFGAKLVLEVFGSSGAIWGFAEIVTLRNHQTQEFWRKAALLVGVIFFIRYLLQIKDFMRQISAKASSGEVVDPPNNMIQLFLPRLVLEVFGGGGAVWGFSEAMTFRNNHNEDMWRIASLSFACITAVRLAMHVRSHWLGRHVEHEKEPLSPLNSLEFKVTSGMTEENAPKEFLEAICVPKLNPNDLPGDDELSLDGDDSECVVKSNDNEDLEVSPIKMELGMSTELPKKPWTIKYDLPLKELAKQHNFGIFKPMLSRGISYASSDDDDELLPCLSTSLRSYGSTEDEETLPCLWKRDDASVTSEPEVDENRDDFVDHVVFEFDDERQLIV